MGEGERGGRIEWDSLSWKMPLDLDLVVTGAFLVRFLNRRLRCSF